jgi:hypothetical protein
MKNHRFLLPGIGLILFFFITGSLSAQMTTGETEKACQDNLKALAFALIRHLGENDGKLPAKISDLYASGLVIDLSVFSCPASGRKIDDPAMIDDLTDYQLVSELTAQRPHLLVQDRYGTHDGMGQAYYSDQKFMKISLPPSPQAAEAAAQDQSASGPAGSGAGVGAGGSPFRVIVMVLGLLILIMIGAVVLLGRRRFRSQGRPATVIDVVYANGTGKRFPLSGQAVSIGRGGDNLLVLHDNEVSSRHAVLIAVPGGWKLQDLGSRNGTWVNGIKVAEALVAAGDRIIIGATTLKLS